MWNIIFTVLFSMVAAGLFENAPIGWKITLIVLVFIAQVMLVRNDWSLEKLQDQTKNLEKKIEQLEKMRGDNK